MQGYPDPKIDSVHDAGTPAVPERYNRESAARQRRKIKEIGQALCAAGFLRLDSQAQVLGLSRSTTWVLLQASHKSVGLTAAVINRMVAAPQLPSPVRRKIVEYAAAKVAGRYGHSIRQRAEFAAKLSFRAGRAHEGSGT